MRNLFLEKERRLQAFYNSVPSDKTGENLTAHHCCFPSVEPNTGVLYIKSSAPSQQFVRKWVIEMVEQNKMNDQRVLSFQFVKNSVHTTSCNLDRETASLSHLIQ